MYVDAVKLDILLISTALKSFGLIAPYTSLEPKTGLAKPLLAEEDQEHFDTGTSRKRPSSIQHPTPTKHSKKVQLSPQTDAKSKTHIFSMPTTYFKPSSIEAKFHDMTNQLQLTLQSQGTKDMLEQCKILMSSNAHNIFLFTNGHLQKLKECKFAPSLIQKLSPHFSWSDHSVLAAVVSACNNVDASNLLDHFDSQIDSSLPVTDYPIPQPSPNMIPYESSSHTVLAVKLGTELRNFSLQNIFDIRFFLQEKFQINHHAFQLLARSSTAIFYWRIPKSIVSIIFSNIVHQCSDLHKRGITELSVYPGLAFVTASNLKVGPLSFFTPVDHMVRITLI